MKYILLFLISTTIFNCQSQNQQRLTYDGLKPHLVDFLISKKEINKERAENLKSGKHTFGLYGAFKRKPHKEELVNGMYLFSPMASHSRYYFVLVENKNFIILDISNRKGLDKSISVSLDYCERQKYCVEVTNEIVKMLLDTYYNKNKNPHAGHDLNCKNGAINLDDLP